MIKTSSLVFVVLETLCYSKQIFQTYTGDTIKLDCPSNDNNHTFKFWQTPHSILGPGKNVSQEHYKYEVLSGTLFIREISPFEQGLYSCYSKDISTGLYKDETLELLVEDDWESSYENDQMTNIYRGIVVLSIGIILVCILCVLYHLHNKNISLITGDSADDQDEESFLPEAMEMTMHLDTDFPKEFTTASNS